MTKPLRVWINTMIKKYAPLWLIKRLTLCKDILPWMEKKEELTFWQKVELRFHIIICPPCWDYEKQLLMISKAYKKIFRIKNTPEQEAKIKRIEVSILEKECKCKCKKKIDS